MRNLQTLFLFGGLLFLSSCYYENIEELGGLITQESCEITEASYSNDVIPILQKYCYSCHNPDTPQGDIDLVGHQKAKQYALDGSLYGSIIFDPQYSVMPPSGQQIPVCDIETIRIWVENGAPNN